MDKKVPLRNVIGTVFLKLFWYYCPLEEPFLAIFSLIIPLPLNFNTTDILYSSRLIAHLL